MTITSSSASARGSFGIDDERAVEALGDVRGERRRVAVVEVEAERLGVELVGERLAGLDQPAADLLAEPGTPSIAAGWMPWKWTVCGCALPFVNRMRSRSPSVQRSVGPGTRPLNVQAAYLTPGAISISLSTATRCHSRSVRPSASFETVAAVEVAHDQARVEAVGLAVDGAAAREAGVARSAPAVSAVP